MSNRLLRRTSPLAYPAGRLPGFDPTHVAANNVVASAVPLGSLFYDPIKSKLSNNSPGGTHKAAILGSIGPCIDFTAKGNVAFPATVSNAATGTIAAIFQQNTSNAGVIVQSILSIGSAGSWMDVTAGGNLELTCAGRGNTTYAAISLNVPYFSAISFVGNSNLDWVLLRLDNGQLKSGTIAIAYTPGLSASSVSIGGYAATTLNFQGYISTALFSNAYIPLPQLLQWAADPWSFWYPPRAIDSFIFSGPAAGGGTVYNVSESETFVGVDTLDAIAVFPSTVAESGTAADTSSSIATLPSTVSEAATGADTTTASSVIPATVAESGAAADTQSSLATLAASIAESGAATDTQSALGTFGVTDSEHANAVDTASAPAPGAGGQTHSGPFFTPMGRFRIK